MVDYKFPLEERFEVAEGTMAFVFDTRSTSSGQASSAPDFTFRAGQYVEIGLESMLYTDEKKDHREFSIASSPTDEGILMVATRLGSPERPISAFKRSLTEIPIGTKAKVKGPYGSFTLHENPAKKAVFIAGGIGITPCRSIIKYATEQKLPHNITLIYSNRNPESAAFLKDLERWQRENKNFKLLATMTELKNPGESWGGLTDKVDANFLKTQLQNFTETIFYVVGPPAMVSGVTKALEEVGVSRDDVRFEEFTGY
ncbi:MAG: FAD-dependent oxidoreductase [bacterium]|nr:FAD-dependent oxidoreductase [bacterium]